MIQSDERKRSRAGDAFLAAFIGDAHKQQIKTTSSQMMAYIDQTSAKEVAVRRGCAQRPGPARPGAVRIIPRCATQPRRTRFRQGLWK